MGTSETRIIVVGAGHMGANHIKKINSIRSKINARISVVVDPDDLRLQAVSREFQGDDAPILISSLGELSKVPASQFPDAAIVAVPSGIHVETTAACLQKGLHCLVEKPLGFSAMDVKDLESKALASKKLLQVGLLERWSFCHLWGNWKPQAGAWTIQTVRCGPFVPRVADTDVVHDLMIHDVDLFVLLNSIYALPKVVSVRSWGRKLRSNSLDMATAALDLEGGGMVRFFASRLSAESYRNWELTGPNWHASIDFMRRSLKRFERVGRNLNSFEAKENSWTGGDPLGLEIEAFVRRVRGEFSGSNAAKELSQTHCDAEKVVPTPQTVLRTHEILDEILGGMQVLEV